MFWRRAAGGARLGADEDEAKGFSSGRPNVESIFGLVEDDLEGAMRGRRRGAEQREGASELAEFGARSEAD